MGEELMKYAMVAIAIATLAFAVFSFGTPAAQPVAGQANNIALQQKQVWQGVSSTSASAVQTQALDNSQCGDLNDDANVQHLGHHPGQYAACLKQVDPAVLKKATGKTLGQLIG